MKNALPNLIGIAVHDISFRKALIVQLCKNLDNKVAFCALNGLDLIKLDKRHSPSVLIVDLYIPVISGIEAIKLIKAVDKSKIILAVSAVFQEDVLALLKHEGAAGYCGHKPRDISVALNEILRVGSFFRDEYYKKWNNERLQLFRRTPSDLVLEELKPIEVRLLQLGSEGKSNKDIATQLNLSERTIDTYINNLVHKLNLRSKLELIKFAFDNGICGCYCENSLAGNCVISNVFGAT